MAEVVVALDLPSADEALRLVDLLPGLRWGKVGPMLFLESGPTIVRRLKERGVRVFLDLKWHDIPHAVAGAVRAARELGVDLATVHTLGGAGMMARAAEAAGPMRVVGVTVLTSHTPADYWRAIGRDGGAEGGVGPDVVRLAREAMRAGLSGVVASPLEIGEIRHLVGAAGVLVVPGIRPGGMAADDQRRTMDPRTAAAAGATHLVIGRPITGASDPRAVYEEVCEAAA